MDWRAGHLTTTEGTGDGAFANKNCPQGRALENLFKCPGYARRFSRGGMFAAGIDSHVNSIRPGLFLGVWALGKGGGGLPADHNSKTIDGIETKIDRVVENHKLINLV